MVILIFFFFFLVDMETGISFVASSESPTLVVSYFDRGSSYTVWAFNYMILFDLAVSLIFAALIYEFLRLINSSVISIPLLG